MAKRLPSYKVSLFERGFAAVVVLLAVQAALGIGNGLFALPLAVAVAHNGGGALLLLTMALLVHTTGQKKKLP